MPSQLEFSGVDVLPRLARLAKSEFCDPREFNVRSLGTHQLWQYLCHVLFVRCSPPSPGPRPGGGGGVPWMYVHFAHNHTLSHVLPIMLLVVQDRRTPDYERMLNAALANEAMAFKGNACIPDAYVTCMTLGFCVRTLRAHA